MFTVIAIMLPLTLITMVIEFCMDIPERIQTRKDFAMYRKMRSASKGC